MAVKILVSIASLCTMGFGVWHFFVPKAYDWYGYISPEATELVAAVRATNVFFSMSLVIFGLLSLIFVLSPKSGAFALRIMLAADVLLWAVRVGMQLVFPQGSIALALQYGMLAAFVIIFGLFLVSFVLSLKSSMI